MWTVESFCELLTRHGTLGPYIWIRYPHHVCIDGYVNIQALVDELNGTTAPAAANTDDKR